MYDKKEITCVLCPNGCDILIVYSDEKLFEIKGALCSKGNDYARQEIKNPKRTLTSSVMVKKGDTSLVSVKTDQPIPLEKVMDVMEILNSFKVEAPVKVGDIILENPTGLDCNIVATREVNIKN